MWDERLAKKNKIVKLYFCKTPQQETNVSE